MCICMCICKCVYVCMYAYLSLSLYIYIYIYIRPYCLRSTRGRAPERGPRDFVYGGLASRRRPLVTADPNVWSSCTPPFTPSFTPRHGTARHGTAFHRTAGYCVASHRITSYHIQPAGVLLDRWAS